MRVLIVAAELSSTTLFDLVVAQEVSSVLDLRTVQQPAPRLLERVYHRPPKALAAMVVRRVVLEAQGLADRTLLVLIDQERITQVRRRMLTLRPDAQIEVMLVSEAHP